MNTVRETVWEVWIEAERKIASFHPVIGYTYQSFTFHDHFLHYMETLRDGGYLFQ